MIYRPGQQVKLDPAYFQVLVNSPIGSSDVGLIICQLDSLDRNDNVEYLVLWNGINYCKYTNEIVLVEETIVERVFKRLLTFMSHS